ncbi:helix-turn-helix transcriptional regulator [Streptomyces violarus]|uniref:helix-turn-helix transcriptional regulator n=1 Tax=Streptomyces violarus TaxID=67380 RepID=UPI0021BF8CFE|nr:helix-turn-helix transcriptional regulator [Streptomyces violarus]MCT9137621.1 helix-turn-helix transcriptional regulator [Streptomyces violarus]
MDNRSEVREFLVSRRGKVTPEQVGLATHSGSRRVPGLRRSEVAELAGVSVDYYTQLERGNVRGASESVLDAVARALQLDEAERAHLFDLARTANAGAAVRRRPTTRRVRPGIQQILDGQLSPAWVGNGRGDIVATNRLGRALNSPLFDDPVRPVNHARFRFLNPRAVDFYRDWDSTARDIVAVLRAEAGKNPYDKALTNLIGELSTRSEEFRTRWAAHDVRLHRTGTKRLHHPVVGDLELSYEGLELPSDPGLMLFIYTAEPGSSSQHALDLLASWAATLAQQEQDGQAQPQSKRSSHPGSL